MLFDTSKYVYALVTSTTYGTWLHGDRRGFVGRIEDVNGNEVIHNIYGTPVDANMPDVEDRDRKQLKTPPVWFGKEHAEMILAQWKETADYLSWTLFAVAVMPNHFHVALSAPIGTDKTKLLKTLKSYASRALNKRYGQTRWWTDSGSVQFRRKYLPGTSPVRAEPGKRPDYLQRPQRGGDVNPRSESMNSAGIYIPASFFTCEFLPGTGSGVFSSSVPVCRYRSTDHPT